MSCLNDSGDALAQGKWYHSHWGQDVIHALPGENETQTDLEIRQLISDIQVIRCVNQIIRRNIGGYRRTLRVKHIPNVEFVRPPQHNGSENVMISQSIGDGDTVDYAIKQDTNAIIDDIVKLSHSL